MPVCDLVMLTYNLIWCSQMDMVNIIPLHNEAKEIELIHFGVYFRDLSGNQLTGDIPNFGNMEFLQTLKVSSNKLSGPSPSFLEITTGGTVQGLANLTYSNDLVRWRFTICGQYKCDYHVFSMYICGLFEIFDLCEHTHIYNFTVDMYEERLTCIT